MCCDTVGYLGKRCLFLITVIPLETICLEAGYAIGNNTLFLGVSDEFPAVLEKQMLLSCFPWSCPYLQQVSKVNSLWLSLSKVGKGSRQI